MVFSNENQWQDIWLTGLEFVENNQYVKAKEMFASAITNMSKEELQENPEVLISLTHANYILYNNDDVLQEANNLLTSYRLSDLQKLRCGNLLVSALWLKGEEGEAVQAYFKYIASSPMVPKCHFKEDKIIISNIPSCEIYKDSFKSFFIQEFCENQADFHEYGNVWSIDVTKKCKCSAKKTGAYQILNKAVNEKRTPQAIRACYNTCSTLAVGADIACSRIPHFVCSTACFLFVEAARQLCDECCYHGGWDEKCWEKFSFWKVDFHNKNPNCPDPKDWL